MKSKQKFPLRMFAAAGIVSGFMMFMISSVFAEVNAPCVNSYSLQNNVVVDTTSQQAQNAQTQSVMAMCNRNDQQIGWLTWLFKESESAQFHYLDLLELLSRK